jgi:hypothetical protein
MAALKTTAQRVPSASLTSITPGCALIGGGMVRTSDSPADAGSTFLVQPVPSVTSITGPTDMTATIIIQESQHIASLNFIVIYLIASYATLLIPARAHRLELPRPAARIPCAVATMHDAAVNGQQLDQAGKVLRILLARLHGCRNRGAAGNSQALRNHHHP